REPVERPGHVWDQHTSPEHLLKYVHRRIGGSCRRVVFVSLAQAFDSSRVVTLQRRITQTEADSEKQQPEEQKIFRGENLRWRSLHIYLQGPRASRPHRV